MKLSIYILEDDKWYGEFLKHNLSLNPDNQIKLFTSGKELLKELINTPDVVCLDFGIPDIDGGTLLAKIKKEFPSIETIIVSGQEDVNTAISLLREGASDYIVKDEETNNRLWATINHIREKVKLKKEIQQLKSKVANKLNHNMIGNCNQMQNVYELIKKAASTSIAVSITGETGTGKEEVAKAIHSKSDRNKKPFIAVNVTAIPDNLIESELFGHEKGAFTGASESRKGRFEEANGGTLFLDEIGEMDLNMQAKLLRVLQEKEVVRVGANKPIKTNVRILTATHRNLIDLVKEGKFRQDLYFRLLGLPIELPPLRERGEDIILLAQHFLKLFCNSNNLDNKTLSQASKKALLKYAFPGNVRELKAIMDLSAVLSQNEEIVPSDLQFIADSSFELIEEDETMRAYTHKIISHYMKKYNNNVLKVAKVLDIGKSTIYRIIKEEINISVI